MCTILAGMRITASPSGIPLPWPGTSNAAHSASSSASGFHPWKTNSYFLRLTHTVGLCLSPVLGSIPMNSSGTSVSIREVCIFLHHGGAAK